MNVFFHPWRETNSDWPINVCGNQMKLVWVFEPEPPVESWAETSEAAPTELGGPSLEAEPQQKFSTSSLT